MYHLKISPLEFEQMWSSGTLTLDHINMIIQAKTEFFTEIGNALTGKSGGGANVSAPPAFAAPAMDDIASQMKLQDAKNGYQ